MSACQRGSYFVFARGGYWRTDVRLPPDTHPSSTWPPIAIVVPARHEAEILPATLPALLAQDYPGPLRIHLVDDSSDDDTVDVATTLVTGAGGFGRLTVVRNDPRPLG